MEPDAMRSLWVVLWFGATVLVLGLPLWPAWREMHHPSDVKPLPLPSGVAIGGANLQRQGAELWPPFDDSQAADELIVHGGDRRHEVDHPGDVIVEAGAQIDSVLRARRVHCDGARLPRTVHATTAIDLGAGSRFHTLSAPVIRTAVRGEDRQREDRVELSYAEALNRPRHCHAGDFELPASTTLVADLVVQGSLTLGQDSIHMGNVKVHGDAELLAGAALVGALFVQGSVHCHGNNRLSGPVAAGKRVWLGPDCVVGRADAKASVSAWDVRLDHDVTVFGRIACVEAGETL
ncbi:hypothetical protein [Ottowia sp.]|uniref:hypothetical protein n=1 Tax=Ottowia sp. TaxID=1898956 RepID=UPI0025F932BB|nr:hypothetical protein [Ottowia sp.]